MLSFERANEIANMYYYDVYRYCLARLKKDLEASEVTQNVFLFFQERYETLDDNHIQAWLISVADRKIKESFREIAKREKELIYGAVFGTTQSADILYEIEQDNNITNQEIEEKKKTILSALTEKELELFEMVYTKHMEYDELAKALNISNGAARTRVSRLKAKIKERVAFAFMAFLLIFMRF